MNNVLIKKNNELEQLKKDYMKIKQELNNYKKINQNLNNQINNVNQKYSEVLKEIRIKNKMISDLEFGNKNLKDINLNEHKNENEENIILSINDQIKNFQKEFFEEENIENEPNNNNEIQNTDKNSLTQLVSNTLNTFMEKLNNYKNENMKEIVKLRNILDSNNKIDISEQYYQKIIDTIKNLCFTIPNNTLNFSKFPTFSKNDNNETKSKNILVSINILSDYIISNNKNNNKNINLNNMKINEELRKKLKEMSELLIKSNENLSKLKKDNIELKQKYNKLELDYNSLNKKEKENYNNKNLDKELESLKDELNKKNQEIKSLEHMITRLTNKIENKEEENKKKKNGEGSIRDKIMNEKNNNLYLQYNKFVKDEKNEKNLKKFLDKFTNGEYGSSFKEKINIQSLKEQVDKLDKRINEELGNDK